MKPLIFSLLLCLVTTTLAAQINFETFNSWEALLAKAKQEKKMIFIQVDAIVCEQCNEVADKGLNSSTLKEKYAVNFISTRIKKDATWFAFYKEQFEITDYVASLYVDANGELLHKCVSSTSYPLFYLEQADRAIVNVERIKAFAIVEKTILVGKPTYAEMENYIIRANELNRNTDKVVEKYLSSLSIDSLQNPMNIKLMMQQGFSLDNSVYKAVWAVNNSKKMDSIWYRLDNKVRVSANNRTISKSWKAAIEHKDRNFVYRITDFIRNVNNTNPKYGQKLATMQELYFYEKIKDTLSYLVRAGDYCNFTLMRISVDSLKKQDFKEQEKMLNSRDSIKQFRMPSSESATDLNNIAFKFYELTKDKMQLEKALKWSKRSLDIEENTNYATKSGVFLDTYAHLLYRLDRFEEAVEWQTKAVEAQADGVLKIKFKQELEKITARTL